LLCVRVISLNKVAAGNTEETSEYYYALSNRRQSRCRASTVVISNEKV